LKPDNLAERGDIMASAKGCLETTAIQRTYKTLPNTDFLSSNLARNSENTVLAIWRELAENDVGCWPVVF
jgi:hypothetical protein